MRLLFGNVYAVCRIENPTNVTMTAGLTQAFASMGAEMRQVRLGWLVGGKLGEGRVFVLEVWATTKFWKFFITSREFRQNLNATPTLAGYEELRDLG